MIAGPAPRVRSRGYVGSPRQASPFARGTRRYDRMPDHFSLRLEASLAGARDLPTPFLVETQCSPPISTTANLIFHSDGTVHRIPDPRSPTRSSPVREDSRRGHLGRQFVEPSGDSRRASEPPLHAAAERRHSPPRCPFRLGQLSRVILYSRRRRNGRPASGDAAQLRLRTTPAVLNVGFPAMGTRRAAVSTCPALPRLPARLVVGRTAAYCLQEGVQARSARCGLHPQRPERRTACLDLPGNV